MTARSDMRCFDVSSRWFFVVKSLSWVMWGVRRLLGCPAVVCLCGSTRFCAAFQEANRRETLAGRLVFTIGCDTKSEAEVVGVADEGVAALKGMLDRLHKVKIVLADEVLVLNVGGYMGVSTASEVGYARRLGNGIRWLEEAC